MDLLKKKGLFKQHKKKPPVHGGLRENHEYDTT